MPISCSFLGQRAPTEAGRCVKWILSYVVAFSCLSVHAADPPWRRKIPRKEERVQAVVYEDGSNTLLTTTLPKWSHVFLGSCCCRSV